MSDVILCTEDYKIMFILLGNIGKKKSYGILQSKDFESFMLQLDQDNEWRDNVSNRLNM